MLQLPYFERLDESPSHTAPGARLFIKTSCWYTGFLQENFEECQVCTVTIRDETREAGPEALPNALITVNNLEKSYAHGTSRTYVLRRINITVKDGEFVSIMGPSGAGKSTLLHIIGMHDSAWTGEYYFLVLCATILAITVFEKFREGGWLTVLATSDPDLPNNTFIVQIPHD